MCLILQPERPFFLGAGATGLVTADLNHDGYTDLVSADTYSNEISVAAGNGAGGFTSVEVLPGGFEPTSVAIGNFAGSILPDIAALSEYNGTLSLLVNNGHGGFRALETSFVDYGVNAMTAVDVGRGSRADLAVTNVVSDSVQLFRTDGLGGFSSNPIATYQLPEPPVAITTADLRADGRSDLIVANAGDSVSVLLSNGHGGFRPAVTYAAGDGPIAITTANLNLDGRPDLVVADSQSNAVSVLLNNGQGGFGPASVYSLGLPAYEGGGTPVAVATGDLRGNGNTDVVVAEQNYYFGSGAGVEVLLGNGHGGFSQSYFASLPVPPVAVAVAQLSPTGHPDIVVTLANGEAEVLRPQFFHLLSASLVATAATDSPPIVPGLHSGS